MKRIMSTILAVMLLLTLTGCRRRVTADSDNIVYETVYQPTPVPMEGEGQQVPDDSLEPDSENTKVEQDPKGEHVDETIAAEGGEEVEQAEKAELGEEITVTLDAHGGECAKDIVKVHVGGVYGVLPVPTLTGQTFQGWFLAPEGGDPVNEITVVLKESDHTLYAHWTTKTEFILTFDPNGGRISPYSASKMIYAGDVYGELPQPINSGFAFLGWFTETAGGEQIHPTDMVTVIDDQTAYAHWEYSPSDYWAFILKNTTQKIFDCQEMKVYVELEAKGSTLLHTPLIEDIGAQNVAEKADSSIVSDSWVADRKPNVVVKITDNMASAETIQTSVEQRFPNAKVYVFPLEAIEGSEAEQIWYKLRLAALCYPSYYAEIDLGAVAEELGVEVHIHK